MNRNLLALAAAFLMGCAGEQSERKIEVQAPKPLFSLWASADSSVTVLDLSRSTSGSSPVTIQFETGVACRCQLQITGQESSGTFTVATCIDANGPTGTTCSSFSSSGTYSKNDTALQICTPTPNPCATYR